MRDVRVSRIVCARSRTNAGTRPQGGLPQKATLRYCRSRMNTAARPQGGLPQKATLRYCRSRMNTAARPQGAIPQKKIGRAHVCTPVTNAHLVCRLLLEKKNDTQGLKHISYDSNHPQCQRHEKRTSV